MLVHVDYQSMPGQYSKSYTIVGHIQALHQIYWSSDIGPINLIKERSCRINLSITGLTVIQISTNLLKAENI